MLPMQSCSGQGGYRRGPGIYVLVCWMSLTAEASLSPSPAVRTAESADTSLALDDPMWLLLM